MNKQQWNADLEGTPDPGIYLGVPFEVYAAWDAVNFSSLKNGAFSWKQYRHEKSKPREPSESMRFGSFVHTAIFEPECLLDRYVSMPDFYQQMIDKHPEKYSDPSKRRGIRSTNEYRQLVEDFEVQHVDCEMISREWSNAAQAIRANLGESERAIKALTGPSDAEVSIVWVDQETGLLCKGRLDLVRWKAASITDGKTTAKLAKFEREIADRCYYGQAAYYIDGLSQLNGGELFAFDIIAIENQEPYDNRTAPLAESAIEAGRHFYRRLLNELAECQRTNHWPGQADPLEWTVPGYIEAAAIAEPQQEKEPEFT